MARDPYEVLGIAADATMAEAKAAYRRLAELFHPDRLAGARNEVRAEAEARLREVVDAMRALRAASGRPLRAPGHAASPSAAPSPSRRRASARRSSSVRIDASVPVPRGRMAAARLAARPSDAVTEAVAREYDAQVRSLTGPRLHVRWGGDHAAAVLAALRHAHCVDGAVRQVEWGCYEIELDGAATRRLLCAAPHGDEWRGEAVEVLRLSGGRVPARRDDAGRPALALGELLGLLDDRVRYAVTADVY